MTALDTALVIEPNASVENRSLHAESAALLIARLERLPFTSLHVRTRITMGSATFFDAFDTLAIAFALPVLSKLWHLSSVEIGLMITASFAGQFIGALVFSRFSEAYGRIPAVALSTLIMSIMCFACVLSGNFIALFLCRFIQGIGVGGEVPVAAVYISESLKARGRGRFFMLYEMIYPIGLLVTGQIGALLVPVYGWQTLFLLGSVPGLIIAVLVYKLPESPRWLITQGRLAEAEQVIQQYEAAALRKDPTFADRPLVIDETGALSPQNTKMAKGKWLELLSPTFRVRTIVCWLLWATAFFVSFSLVNWLPTLYTRLYKLDLTFALRAAACLNIAQVLLLLVCASVIDRVGRRYWAIACFSVSAMFLAMLGFGLSHNVVFVIVLTTLAYGTLGGITSMLYLYTPEIYPTRMRAIGTGVSSSWLRLAAAVGPSVVGGMLQKGGVGSVFLLFAGVAVLGALVSTQILDTENRRLEAISS